MIIHIKTWALVSVSHIFYKLGGVGKLGVELLRCTKAYRCCILFLVCTGAIRYLKVMFWRSCTSKGLPIKIRITTIPRDEWIIFELNQRVDLNSNISSQPLRPASVIFLPEDSLNRHRTMNKWGSSHKSRFNIAHQTQKRPSPCRTKII